MWDKRKSLRRSSESQQIGRRNFLKKSGVVATAIALGRFSTNAAEVKPVQAANPLPRWRGFNLTDLNSPIPGSRPSTSDDELKWIADWGFDFVRLPMAYPRYLEIDRSKAITPADVYKTNEQEVDRIEKFARKIIVHGLHVSLNLHRAPGYCINAGFSEPFDLWNSNEAQDAFAFHWQLWAKRFKDVSASKISFDLLNEPAVRLDLDDQHSRTSAVPGNLYHAVAERATDAIRGTTPERIIIADGNNVGYQVTPELKDLQIAQSCRGYNPHYISHYKAPWANKDPEKCPEPTWPGAVNGAKFDRAGLEKFYRPWVDLAKSGVGVHCGECGCWNKTPHAVFLAWFGDVLEILTANKIGYALWNFRGDFGILDSGRKDVDYQDWHGHKLDAKLLELLKKN
jgi:aryl-phospho-beta-D-glucosidase BglC (GH1 family)